MNINTAIVLLENLLDRVEIQEDGSKQITGVLTDAELKALRFALAKMIPDQPVSVDFPTDNTQPEVALVSPTNGEIELDISSLSLPKPSNDARLCLDFGTAMSKATLVQDNDDNESEEIHVLPLGVPGDQEEISEVMLISSVFIDNEGNLWFGNAAVEHSKDEGGNGTRQRLDNIKRRLSEGGWDEIVTKPFNPTDVEVIYGDMVLAYLMFMTWTVNSCLDELDYPLNLPRRYAMPCLTGERKREAVHRLKQLIGEAQVLADTFNIKLKDSIPISVTDFMAAVKRLRQNSWDYPFVAEDITEPLGVAGSMMNWKAPVDALIMVVDVGAGTSDLSLYRIRFDPESDQGVAFEVKDSSRVLTEAGNHLDRILIELIIRKSGITSDNPIWVNVRGELQLRIRDFKETLFNEESVYIPLMNGTEVDVNLMEFLKLKAVQSFGTDLRNKMIEILESIDQSWVDWIKADPRRYLTVALTGGGSELPMVKPLAEGSIRVNEMDVPVARSRQFPNWLRELDENLESDYPRVAVSLGGARKRLIQDKGTAAITGGDVTQTPVLGGYYQKGN